MMKIDWKEVTVTFNDNKTNLPRIVVIKLHDKIKIRRLMNRQSLLFHVMIKQGIMWFTLATETLEIMQILKCISNIFQNGLLTPTQMQLLAWLF